jgi:hypothetical protein
LLAFSGGVAPGEGIGCDHQQVQFNILQFCTRKQTRKRARGIGVGWGVGGKKK